MVEPSPNILASKEKTTTTVLPVSVSIPIMVHNLPTLKMCF